jgi:cyanophycin synthetase
VLTNVSSDHMDLQGIHTLPELAQVKGVIARITRPDGVVVLNADDDLVVELEGRARREIMPVTGIPAALGGLARHNVANALAAAAGARAMGATIDQVATGLAGFGADPGDRYGRLDLYRRGDTTVVVDFAHNEAGMDALMAVGEGLAGDRAARAGRRTVAIILGSAGDRPDDTLRGMGRIAAERADRVIIKEMLHYLRGRTRESVIGELRVGLASGGMDPRGIPVETDEPSAVRAALAPDGTVAGTGLPGVLLVLSHEDRAGVVAVLTGLGFEPVTGA